MSSITFSESGVMPEGALEFSMEVTKPKKPSRLLKNEAPKPKQAEDNGGRQEDEQLLNEKEWKIVHAFEQTGIPELVSAQRDFPPSWGALIAKIKATLGTSSHRGENYQALFESLLSWTIKINEKNYSDASISSLFDTKEHPFLTRREQYKQKDFMGESAGRTKKTSREIDIMDTVIGYETLSAQKWQEEPYQKQVKTKKNTLDRMNHFMDVVSAQPEWQENCGDYLEKTRVVYKEMEMVDHICNLASLADKPLEISDRMARAQIAKLADQLRDKLVQVEFAKEGDIVVGIAEKSGTVLTEAEKIADEIRNFDKEYRKDAETHTQELRKTARDIALRSQIAEKYIKEAIEGNKEIAKGMNDRPGYLSDVGQQKKLEEKDAIIKKLAGTYSEAEEMIERFKKENRIMELSSDDLTKILNNNWAKVKAWIHKYDGQFFYKEAQNIGNTFGHNFIGVVRTSDLYHRQWVDGRYHEDEVHGENLVDFSLEPDVNKFLEKIKNGRANPNDFTLSLDFSGTGINLGKILNKPRHVLDSKISSLRRTSRNTDVGELNTSDFTPIDLSQQIALTNRWRINGQKKLMIEQFEKGSLKTLPVINAVVDAYAQASVGTVPSKMCVMSA